MFCHALDEQGYPKDGFLRGSRTNLECYDDGRLVNYGSIKLRLQYYSDKSFQDHYFYVVETKMTKEIIVGHPPSTRLGLIHVLCKNISKSVSAIENKTNTNSRESFQDHYLKIDVKTPLRNQRVAYKSFQGHPSSSFNIMARSHVLRLLSRPQPNMHDAGESKTDMSTSFKTISIDGIRVIKERIMPTESVTQSKIEAERLLLTPWVSLGGKRFPSNTWNMKSVRQLLSRPLIKVELKEFLSNPGGNKQ